MSDKPRYTILRRDHREVNNDPQRRCYNGCHASTEVVTSPWDTFDFAETEEKAKEKLKFWTELNDFAVSQRGKGAKTEYKIVEDETNKDPYHD